MPTAAMELSRSQRLDRLPLTAAHRRLLAGSGVGWALDAMDVGLVSFILAALAVQWSLSPGQLSLIASIGFVGMAVGAGLGGLLADRVGRRSVFALTLLVYGLATGASALATGVAMLLVLRFITGLGLGAELPVASTLVSEYAPARIRGRVVVILESFWAVGWVGAALIGYFVVPSSANGWRWAFALGMLPAAYAIVVRWKLPESVRFLERRGRTAEAEAAVRRFEASAGVDPVPSPDHPPATDVRPSLAQLVDAEVPGAHDRLWLTWFGVNFAYYGAFIWLPTLLVASGFGLVKSFEYTLIITLAQLPGLRGGRGADRAMGAPGDPGDVPRRVGRWRPPGSGSRRRCPRSWPPGSRCRSSTWAPGERCTPSRRRSIPTALRATGAGSATAFGRIAAIVAPLVVLPIRGVAGNLGLFTVFAVAFCLAMVAAVFLPEWRGRELQD